MVCGVCWVGNLTTEEDGVQNGVLDELRRSPGRGS